MYLVFDLETENHNTYKRFANPFDPINYVVARGWKKQGDDHCSHAYFTEAGEHNRLHIPDDVTLLVGHNIKFDLLYEWKNPELIAFFKRGGKVWDTQYAEYLIHGMAPEYHMIAMDDIAVKYGGRVKINAVKALWDAGVLTSNIDKDMLIDYLVGTHAEGRNSGDIGNTEKIFLGQLKKANSLNMVPMIMARMDGLCGTTEMEFNGLKIDVQEAKRCMEILVDELDDTIAQLEQYIPELPEGLDFNWQSNIHTSCLVFGGTIKYKRQDTYIDPATGELARKQATEQWYLVNGVPTHPDEAVEPDRYVSGKKKGTVKTVAVKVPGELKVKYQDFVFTLPGYTKPERKWQSSVLDGAGKPVYSTAADIIEELGKRDIPFLKLMSRRQDIVKDLGTYYVRFDGKELKGMLTCVMRDLHIIHHSLNHVNTVTSRLSSNNPNLQNVPKADTSEVKKMFISRWLGEGQMVEADYSQLEVVVQAMLSKDKQLVADLNNKVDFHCKRVSAWKGCTYDEALLWCKDESYPDYKLWKGYRNAAKIFSFQRAYGAGAALIAEYTGMDIEEVKALIAAEERLYPGIIVFNDMVETAVKKSAKPFKDPIRGFKTFRKGHWQCPTGTMYCWRTYEAPQWMQDRGIPDSFKPTELKNYPVQGTGGEIVQIIVGKLWRHFLACDNYGGLALMCNTVHDSVWFDSHKSVLLEMAADVKRIMESVPETLEELYDMEVLVSFPVDIEAGDNLFTKHQLHF